MLVWAGVCISYGQHYLARTKGSCRHKGGVSEGRGAFSCWNVHSDKPQDKCRQMTVACPHLDCWGCHKPDWRGCSGGSLQLAQAGHHGSHTGLGQGINLLLHMAGLQSGRHSFRPFAKQVLQLQQG